MPEFCYSASFDEVKEKGFTLVPVSYTHLDVYKRQAFNLWNGFTEEGRENLCTPEELFCCGYAPYFMEGIKLRYPEYCGI